MKIIEGFKIICIDGDMMAVSTGDANDVFMGVINLNKTAHKIWMYIEEGLSLDEISARLSDEYDGLSIEDASRYVRDFANKLIEKGILVED